MESQFAAQANITFVSAWTSIRTQDIATNNYLQAPSDGRLDSINYTYAWSDPTDDMISMAHELTLRAAIATTNALITTSSLDIQLDTIPNLLTQGQPEILSPNLTLVNRTVDQEVDVAMTFEEIRSSPTMAHRGIHGDRYVLPVNHTNLLGLVAAWSSS
jgi:hypothetical protein